MFPPGGFFHEEILTFQPTPAGSNMPAGNFQICLGTPPQTSVPQRYRPQISGLRPQGDRAGTSSDPGPVTASQIFPEHCRDERCEGVRRHRQNTSAPNKHLTCQGNYTLPHLSAAQRTRGGRVGTWGGQGGVVGGVASIYGAHKTMTRQNHFV